MIHAFHGNFGLPGDWAAALPLEVPVKAWNLWEIRRHHPETATLTGFAQWFNRQILSESRTDDGSRILAGYSLGGRLALHVLLDQPHLWHSAVILSAHPGLKTPADRTGRSLHDARWRQLCQSLSWKEVCSKWNAQPVLKGNSAAPPPAGTETWREEIASAFEGWSLGTQKNLLPLLTQCGLPIWLGAGELDLKFSNLAGEMSEVLPRCTSRIFARAGHRLLTECPLEVGRILLEAETAH